MRIQGKIGYWDALLNDLPLRVVENSSSTRSSRFLCSATKSSQIQHWTFLQMEESRVKYIKQEFSFLEIHNEWITEQKAHVWHYQNGCSPVVLYFVVDNARHEFLLSDCHNCIDDSVNCDNLAVCCFIVDFKVVQIEEFVTIVTAFISFYLQKWRCSFSFPWNLR